MATYYISPTGSDGAAGTTGAPKKTFAHCIGLLNPGDTLILKDGTYNATNSGYPSIVGKNGTSLNRITIKAENERQAFISGNGTQPFVVVNCSYLTIEGIRVRNIDAQINGVTSGSPLAFGSCNNLIVRRMLSTHNNRYYNGSIIDLYLVNDSLFEENECYWYHRNGFGGVQSNCIFRRNYVNSRHYPDLAGGYPSSSGEAGGVTGDSGLLVYPGSYNTFENNIAEDVSCAFDIQGYGASLNNQYLGNIALNCTQGLKFNTRTEAPGSNVQNTYVENNVCLNCRSTGIYLRTTTNTTVKNCTVINNVGVGAFFADLYGGYAGDGSSSVFATNVLVANNLGMGFSISGQSSWSLNYCNAYNSGTPFTPVASDSHITNERTIDPQLAGAKIWIPPTSPMKGTGLNGADIGANIIYKYQDGILTGNLLWGPSFPHGAIIAGVNDIAGSSAFDVHTRLGLMPTGAPPVADVTPPSVSITSPSASSTVSGTITITATATDNVGVANVQFYLDGAPLGSPQT